MNDSFSQDCRRKAAACRYAAHCAPSTHSKAEWEVLRDEWLRLANEVEGLERGGARDERREPWIEALLRPIANGVSRR